MLNGEVISPPAGAIGRGDAFVLRIAERTGATVLSNDSFQEFHGEHPWLFDEGRLIGGKPVPGRGLDLHAPAAHPGPQEPGGHGRGESQGGTPLGAGQGGRAGQGGQEGGQARRPRPRRRRRRPTGRRLRPGPSPRPAPPPGRAKVDPVFSSAIDEAVEEALHPADAREAEGREEAGRAKKAAPQKSAKAKKEAPGRQGQDARLARPEPQQPAPTGNASRRSARPRPSTSRSPSSTSSPPSPWARQWRARSCRSPRTGPWSTCRCPEAACCTATSR